MAIRKDIDDMLNNLKDGKSLELPTTPPKKPAQPIQPVQEKMNSASLDELLTSLIGDRGSETAAEPSAEPEIKPRKKKIVINHELPDYEAIREAELKKDAERAEAEKQAEREQLKAEREAEMARIKAERKAAEEAELARIEAERKAAEEAELARIEAERKAAEEAELARIEAERRAAEEAELARIEAERKAAKEAELARIEAERQAAEKAELARIEAERRAAEENEIQPVDSDDIMAEAISAVANEDAPDEEYDIEQEFAELLEEERKFRFFKNSPRKKEKREKFAESETQKTGFTEVLHNILDEEPDAILNQRKNLTEYESAPKKDRIKRGFYAVFGVIFSLLACVGLVTVIAKGISLFNSYSSGETRKEGFENVIYPAVIMDIESFKSPAELPSEQILTAAIWSMIMTDGVTEQYELTFDVVIIPAADVESYAVKLFGDTLPELTHTTVGPAESRFYYNEETKSYNVPVAPVTYTYAPEIKEATQNGNEYTVKVDYIDELPSWLPKTSSKSVKFTLTESNGEYQLKSMEILTTSTNAV